MQALADWRGEEWGISRSEREGVSPCTHTLEGGEAGVMDTGWHQLCQCEMGHVIWGTCVVIMVVVDSPRARKNEVVPTCSSHGEPPEVGGVADSAPKHVCASCPV